VEISVRRAALSVAMMGCAALAAAGDTPRRDEAAPAPPPTVASTTLPPTTTTTLPPTTTTTLPPTYPLTGRPAPDAETRDRAAVTVKIDNAAAARPQAGLEHADLVYEEFTEGITRLVAVFHSTEAEVAGPVRSVRPADPDIVAPLGGVLGFSGGSPAAVEIALAAPFTSVTEGDVAVMYRRPGRFAPHNLYTATSGLRSRAPGDVPPPQPFGEFLRPGATFTGPDATPVSRVDLVPAPYITAAYDWDGSTNTWKRWTDGVPHLLEGDTRIAPTNVILQFANYVTFAFDAGVQYPEVVGTGEAWFFSAGLMVKGSWSKGSAAEPTRYATADGNVVALTPGQTWVHLLPLDAPVSTG
jgi:hypothetical protein